MKKLTMIGMASLLTACSTAPDMEQQIDELYGKMSQEERIAQLRSMYMDDLFDEQGPRPEGVARPHRSRAGLADEEYAQRHPGIIA